MGGITLSETDLSRISVASMPSLALEVSLSLQILDRRSAGSYARWRSRTRARLRLGHGGGRAVGHGTTEHGAIGHGAFEHGALRIVRRVIGGAGTLADQVRVVSWAVGKHDPLTLRAEAGADAGAEAGAGVSGHGTRRPTAPPESVPAQPVVSALLWYCETVIAPYWNRFRAAVESERAVHARALLSGGPDELLRSLGHGLAWRRPRLWVEGDGEAGPRLRDGGGLVVVPSVFCERSEILLPDADRPLLVHPMGTSARDLALGLRSGPGEGVNGRRALRNLLGGTRAAILAELHSPYTTTEVARRHDLAPGTVSRHLSVLRDAGLVGSRRRANEVLYVATPLGRALVDSVSGAG
ncbi:ArsR/SmtB family transcription factor [Microbispora sp. H10885]|uniref:ArsR/SmtB family transcription factor n=1 Tax=Microbispora sp. H10885 TaxID=2729110 RepID=UPI0015FECC1B|nr:winged helix-turn-helix domain-containing protein [Microbispora sp. H10885]